MNVFTKYISMSSNTEDIANALKEGFLGTYI